MNLKAMGTVANREDETLIALHRGVQRGWKA
jgi:hypothetical protein